jgi:hypothetical protein
LVSIGVRVYRRLWPTSSIIVGMNPGVRCNLPLILIGIASPVWIPQG